ncbi:MAG: hypothetical protein K2L31_03350, partial [Muribaculum sp.]|nr:hypothetical protein [Muribaculum sp.]
LQGCDPYGPENFKERALSDAPPKKVLAECVKIANFAAQKIIKRALSYDKPNFDKNEGGADAIFLSAYP